MAGSRSRRNSAGSTRRQSRRERPQKKNNQKTAKIVIGLLVVIAAIIGFMNLRSTADIESDIRLTDKGYTHADRFRSSIVVNGIDVSSHQGDDINWGKVKSSGVDFVFVRAGVRLPEDGSIDKDRNFVSNVKDAHKAGLLVGAYFYSQATSADEAAEEADFMLDTVSGMDIDLPLVIDYELYSGGRLAGKVQSGELFAASQYNDIVTAFCDKVEAAGYSSGVYANYDMFTNYMDASLIAGSTNLWVAQYNSYCSFTPEYMFWQCSDSAETGGIEGSVDHDFWYIEPEKVYETPAGSDTGSADAVSIGKCTIELDKDSYPIRKLRAEPEVSVSYNGSALDEGSDYTAVPIMNIDEGTGYVIVRGTGGFKDWKAVPFTIK